MADDQQKRGGGIGEGIRSGIGILNAFREAVEETVQEVVDRGDLKPDRAKQAVKDAAHRMQEVFDDARERLDFVPRAEFDALREEVEALRRRVDHLHPAGVLPASSPSDAGPDGGIIEVPGREPPPEPSDGGPRIVIESE